MPRLGGEVICFRVPPTSGIRDAAPYGYAVLVFLVFPLGERDEGWASRAITAALVFHAAWLTGTLLGLIGPVGSLGGGQAQVFESRPDIDATVCGLLSVVALNRALLGRGFAINLLLAAWGAGLVFALQTRAGLLAFVAQVAALVLLTRARTRARTIEQRGASGPRQRLRMLRARSAPAVVTAALLVLAPLGAVAAQASVDRLLATFAHQAESSAAAPPPPPGTGTAAARTAAWRHLVGWLMENPSRTILGVGPGPDFLQESGTAEILLGPHPIEETRNPHDYLLNTWARFGLIGWALILGVLMAGWRLAILVARWSSTLRDSDLLAIMIAISIPVVAMFGVVLEAPFGAIPYFWALGHLGARWRALARKSENHLLAA